MSGRNWKKTTDVADGQPVLVSNCPNFNATVYQQWLYGCNGPAVQKWVSHVQWQGEANQVILHSYADSVWDAIAAAEHWCSEALEAQKAGRETAPEVRQPPEVDRVTTFAVFGGFGIEVLDVTVDLLLQVLPDVAAAEQLAIGLVNDLEMLLKHHCSVAIRHWYGKRFSDPDIQADHESRLFSELAETLEHVKIVRLVDGMPDGVVTEYLVNVDADGLEFEDGDDA